MARTPTEEHPPRNVGWPTMMMKAAVPRAAEDHCACRGRRALIVPRSTKIRQVCRSIVHHRNQDHSLVGGQKADGSVPRRTVADASSPLCGPGLLAETCASWPMMHGGLKARAEGRGSMRSRAGALARSR
ncbi:hypothetical protein C8Q80DRAFT_478999 [Daedaleopsis nitida]|nr:hypothetical protein C8Q80DRAFT_478999 [Daedaleopsis nitida]